jgi:hypothetical protein
VLVAVQLAAEDLAELSEEPLELLHVDLERHILHEDVRLVRQFLYVLLESHTDAVQKQDFVVGLVFCLFSYY